MNLPLGDDPSKSTAAPMPILVVYRARGAHSKVLQTRTALRIVWRLAGIRRPSFLQPPNGRKVGRDRGRRLLSPRCHSSDASAETRPTT